MALIRITANTFSNAVKDLADTKEHKDDAIEPQHRAKDSGDIETLREIAEDPHGFILRQGWASLISARKRNSLSCGDCLDGGYRGLG